MKLTPVVVFEGEVYYIPSFLTDCESANYFLSLKNETSWQQDTITLFGKTHLQPRLTALFADGKKRYSYSGITMFPHPFTNTLKTLKTRVEKATHTSYNACLLNLYRNGKDSNGWHADDEKELGENPVIASVSLGAGRWFHLQHKKNKALKHKIFLENGSLLLMKGATQHHWKHQLPKTTRQIGERINLTFRTIL